MFLTRLIYASSIAEGFNISDVENIIHSARENNSSLDVTGLLCFNQNYFLQCLEGSRTNVNHVYQQILNDHRHTKIIMLDYREISVREFSSWAMGYVPATSMTAPINLRYSGSREFNPYAMSGNSAHALMLELRSSIPTV